MPLNLSPLPTDLADGAAGHTAGHNTTNTAVNSIATAVDANETTMNTRVDGLDGISNVGTIGATPLTVNPGNGNGTAKLITLGDNATINFGTPPATGWIYTLEFVLTQNVTGGKTVAWPASVKWPGGVAPTLSTAGGSVDRLVFVTYDRGTTWYGDLVGKGYA